MTESAVPEGAGRWAAMSRAVNREAGRLAETRGWQRYAIAFGLGALTATALAPYYILPALVLGYVGLVILLDGAAGSGTPKRMAFLTGWAFGFGYFLLGMYWLGFAFLVQADEFGWMIPIAVPAFTGFLGLFFALPVWLAMFRWQAGWQRVVLLAALLALFEYVRGNILTGLPWNLTSQAFAGTALLAQPLAWLGPYGYSLVLLALAMLPVMAWQKGQSLDWRPLAGLVGGILAILAFGAARLSITYSDEPDDLVLVVVQPNIPQREKIDPAKWDRNFERLINLTGAAAETHDDVVAIWPENADPRLASDPNVPALLARSLPPQTALLSGTIRRWSDETGHIRYGNSAALFGFTETGADGLRHKPVAHLYDKHHLVPFGEYLPMKGLLTRLGLSQLAPVDEGFTPGPGPSILTYNGISISVLICYEDVFPRQLYPRDDRPDLLAVITNDAWFGDNAGPRQHLDISRMRTIESGIPMVRSANTGISGVFDPRGRLVEQIPLYEQGVISTQISMTSQNTQYDRLGELVFFLLVVVALLTTIFGRLARVR